ncbi:MAG: thioredoxin family protein [Ignavibacteria bacterium]|jgi:small redox-active disulfide protein 2|nr:thioredoxin family protein [Ignavibacteria bacterium]MDH7526606.1 thioredoxin family protein [Ignavibacteria bacterium]
MLDIKVLGPGCMNCEKLFKLCSEVIQENNIEAKLEKVVKPEEFMKYGIMLTPALVINNKVITQGKIPTKATLENWLKNFNQ